MDSKILLRIKDQLIRNNYTIERSKDVVFACFLTFVIRTINMVLGIVSSATELRNFSEMYWVVRGVGLGWHALLLFLGYKWPLFFAKV